MVLMKIADRPAVRNKMAFKSPFTPQLSHQIVAGTAGFTVGAVIGSHYRFNIRILNQGTKSGKISLFQILRGSDCVEAVAKSFRPAVHGEMLGTCGGFQRFSVALQAVYECLAEAGGEIRVLAVCFMAASPARITEDVDVR